MSEPARNSKKSGESALPAKGHQESRQGVTRRVVCWEKLLITRDKTNSERGRTGGREERDGASGGQEAEGCH